MSHPNSSHPKVFLSPYLEEKAKTDPAYARFDQDIEALVTHLQGFEAHFIGGEKEETTSYSVNDKHNHL